MRDKLLSIVNVGEMHIGSAGGGKRTREHIAPSVERWDANAKQCGSVNFSQANDVSMRL